VLMLAERSAATSAGVLAGLLACSRDESRNA